MNRVSHIFRIACLQMGKLTRNPRLYMIVFCNFIFLTSLMSPLRSFLRMYQLKATPFLFCFLFTHASVIFCFLAGIILLFSNAPFFDHSQMFLVIRTGKTRWALGQMIYMLLGSILYFLLLYGMSVLFLLPYLSFQNEWGSVWNTLARTDLGVQFGVSLTVPANILNHFEPMELLSWTFFMGILNAMVLGLLLFFCNLFLGRMAGITAAVLFLLTPFRLSFMPDFLHYLAAPAWMDPAYLLYNPNWRGPDARQQILILCGMLLLLALGCIWGIRHKDLPEVEE